ncbi:MAG: DNA mismatch repair protein [Polyangiaceae bacterium]|jgi:DNA mismatch repair protein MutS2|nr:DNA mismatch repair protein [Polyangiaceae bacterium]
MSNASIPDLLHPEPMQRIDLEHTKIALSLAFAGGVSGGTFSEALEKARVAPTTWDPKVFVPDLFLQQFVALCYRVRIGGDEPVVCAPSLIRLLSNPPSDGAIVEHRRAVLAELLASAPLRGATERLYTSICRLRTLLEGAFGRGGEANRRQLDILQTFKSIVDLCADGFVAASSGLSRLAAFGGRIRGGEPYRSLSDLLKYDDRLANLTLNVRVGADGRIRAFEVLKVGENEDNPFVSSPLRRWLSKIELFVRGYKFSEGEVMARLIDAVFTGIEDELAPLVQLLGDLEFYLGALGFHDTAKAAGLAVSLPTFVEARAPRKLKGLFNPLLLAHGMKPVPCQLDTDRHDVTVLVTGPNSGGKTRLLQSIALSQLLAQCGCFVPAREAELSRASGLVVSLIEQQKADQSEGRLGTELVRIRELFEKLPPSSMVILDELCSGTNPSEGEEIFELVVQMLAKLGPQAFITTHFLAFAGRLERESGISGLRFLQVELGAEHRPTYQFTGGVAKTSLAAHAASRLGVTRDQLLSLVDRNTRAATGKEI